MQRSASREQAFLLLFENSFNNYPLNKLLEVKLCENQKSYKIDDFSKELFLGVKSNENSLNETIARYSKNWNKDRISRVSSCILKIATYEILFRADIPNSVSVNEAVNLAKKYGTEAEYAFVNGVLGKICPKQENEKSKELTKAKAL